MMKHHWCQNAYSVHNRVTRNEMLCKVFILYIFEKQKENSKHPIKIDLLDVCSGSGIENQFHEKSKTQWNCNLNSKCMQSMFSTKWCWKYVQMNRTWVNNVDSTYIPKHNIEF